MLFKNLNNVVENILNNFCLDTFLTVHHAPLANDLIELAEITCTCQTVQISMQKLISGISTLASSAIY